ncbi:MAG: hypothetical protein WCG09_09505 [Halobacteriota archaeon]|jgi:hypothetical protein
MTKERRLARTFNEKQGVVWLWGHGIDLGRPKAIAATIAADKWRDIRTLVDVT